jgi:inhibitor of KinA
MNQPFRIVAAGDSTVILELDNRIDAEVNARAVAIAAWMESLTLHGVRDVVPTYRTVGVYFDPRQTDVGALTAHLERGAIEVKPGRADESEVVRIPVCYGGALGPDLSEVAAVAGLNESEVVSLHTARRYRVFMLGFVPGFAYMASVDPRIAMPRRPVPRVRVPAGSVGIAGSQTAIYPQEVPGGWRLVGRTPAKLVDFGRADPFLLKAGDSVAFEPIDAGEFARLSR